MRKIATWAIWLIPGLLLALVGCAPSLRPLYNDQNLIFDQSLVGVWRADDSQETWTVSPAGEKEYKLIHIEEDGKKGEFIVHLVNVEGQMFLDLFPIEPGRQESGFYRDHFLRTHTFVAVLQIEPTIRISYIDPDWLKKFLEERPESLRHEKINGEILITASPEEMQRFLLSHLKTEGAFSEEIELKRASI